MDGVSSPPRTDVVFVGRANIDLAVRIPYRPGPGQTAFGSELVSTPGGKSLNQAIAVARLGGRATLVANAGDDHWGRHLMTSLIEAAVDVTHFHLLPGVPTGAAIIEVTPDGENYLILSISPGTELNANQVDDALARVDAPVTVVQLDLPPEPVTQVLSAPGRGTIRIGNLVPHPGLDMTLMKRLDVLVVNQHEAATILGVADISPRAAARQLRQLGPRRVVVTAGRDGAAYSDIEQSDTIDAHTVEVVDTTGAGDAFLGSLALDLAKNMPLSDAVPRAVSVGAEAVQHRGAQLPPKLALKDRDIATPKDRPTDPAT